MSATEEDPFFKSLSALKDLLFNQASSAVAAIHDVPVPPQPEQPDRDDARAQLVTRVVELEAGLREARAAAAQERGVRGTLNAAFEQLTQHNRLVNEQLAAAEASQERLRVEVETLKQSNLKEKEHLKEKQQEWEAERRSLVESREAALKECDSWQAKLASEERHVQDYKARCEALKQEYEMSIKSLHDASEPFRSEASTSSLLDTSNDDGDEQRKLMERVSKQRAEIEQMREENIRLTTINSTQASILAELEQLLSDADVAATVPDEAAAAAARSSSLLEEELAARKNFATAMGRLLKASINASNHPDKNVTYEDIDAAKADARRCKELLQAAVSRWKRARPSDEETEESDNKRPALANE